MLKNHKVVFDKRVKMQIIVHLITSIILALLLFAYFGWYSLLIFIGGVLIDIDHYFIYIIKHKKINILKSYVYFRDRDIREAFNVFCVFHLFELFIILLIASFFSKIVWIIAAGFFVHYVLDIIYEFGFGGGLIKNWSLITWLRKRPIHH